MRACRERAGICIPLRGIKQMPLEGRREGGKEKKTHKQKLLCTQNLKSARGSTFCFEIGAFPQFQAQCGVKLIKVLSKARLKCSCAFPADKKQDGSVENRKKGTLLAHTPLSINPSRLCHLHLCISPSARLLCPPTPQSPNAYKNRIQVSHWR